MKLVHINRHCTLRIGKRNSANLRNKISVKDILRLKPLGHIHKLGLRMATRFDPLLAKAFTQLDAVDRLHLHGDISRHAMRPIVSIPNLQSLDIRQFVGHGRLPSFQRCKTLTEFRAQCISEPDLLRVLHCQTLRYLGIHCGRLSHASISAIARLPHIQSVYLPRIALDDRMIAQLTAISTLTHLHLTTSHFSRDWIAAIAQMTQLHSLGLDADQIEIADLAPLAALPHLADLTLSIRAEKQTIDSARLIELLETLPTLKTVWFDGMTFSAEQIAWLESRYESAMI